MHTILYLTYIISLFTRIISNIYTIPYAVGLVQYPTNNQITPDTSILQDTFLSSASGDHCPKGSVVRRYGSKKYHPLWHSHRVSDVSETGKSLMNLRLIFKLGVDTSILVPATLNKPSRCSMYGDLFLHMEHIWEL